MLFEVELTQLRCDVHVLGVFASAPTERDLASITPEVNAITAFVCLIQHVNLNLHTKHLDRTLDHALDDVGKLTTPRTHIFRSDVSKRGLAGSKVSFSHKAVTVAGNPTNLCSKFSSFSTW